MLSQGKMDEQKEQRAEKEEEESREKESRIDYHIGATRAAFNPKTVFAVHHSDEEVTKYHPVSEFTFSNRSGPIIGRYLWLVSKLAVLYLVKAFRWVRRLGKHE